MIWKFERRLVFVVSEKWSGWYCERCCWSRPLPAGLEERERQARAVESEYRDHDCDQFARENWRSEKAI